MQNRSKLMSKVGLKRGVWVGIFYRELPLYGVNIFLISGLRPATSVYISIFKVDLAGNKRLIELRYEMYIITFKLLFKFNIYSSKATLAACRLGLFISQVFEPWIFRRELPSSISSSRIIAKPWCGWRTRSLISCFGLTTRRSAEAWMSSNSSI